MVRWRLLVGLGVLLVSAACGGSPTNPGPVGQNPPPQAPPPPVPAPPPVLGVTRILAFGDSLTAGNSSPSVSFWIGIDPGLPQSYVFKLNTIVTQRYSGQTISLFNAGFAGRRASEDRGRLIDALRETTPQVLLLMQGANDLNQDNARDAISPTIGALEEMIGEAQARNVRVFIGTLPPQRIGGKSGAAQIIGEFNTELRRMAPDEGATLVDVFAGMSLDHIGQDGLHPTEAGYQRMAEIWFDALAAAFEQTPQPSSSRTNPK